MTRSLIVVLLGAAALSAAPGKQTFTGIITDGECPRADHSRMRMGATDAECVAACIDTHGAVYVLYDGKSAYSLGSAGAADKFAARRVNVTGTLDSRTKTISVDAINLAK